MPNRLQGAAPAGLAPMLAASACFGLAIRWEYGGYSKPGLVFMAVACLLVGLNAARLARRRAFTWAPWVRWPLWGLAVTLSVVALTDRQLLLYPQSPWTLGRAAQGAMLALLLSYVPALLGRWPAPRWLMRARFAAFATAIAVAGASAFAVSPRPEIDVWTVQQAGAEALLRGENPYVAVAMTDTGPRTAQDVPYVYPPTQVLLTLPAFLLFHDVRFAMLLAVLLAGFALRYVARAGDPEGDPFLADAPALFLWLSPRLFFVLEQSWVDPVQVALVSLTAALWASRRFPTATALLTGLLLSAKQTMFWAVGLFALHQKARRWPLIAGVAAAFVAPFALWDFAALKHATFDFVAALPVRDDALTFNNFLRLHLGFRVPPFVGFVLAAAVALFATFKLRGTLERFGTALVATYAAFFTFNKWTFANYEFTLAAFAALAAACSAWPEPTTPDDDASLERLSRRDHDRPALP